MVQHPNPNLNPNPPKLRKEILLLSYSTATIDAHDLADPNRGMVHTKLNELARNRSLALKEAQKLPGRIATAVPERAFGDVVLVMVDPGEGEAAQDAIAKLIREGL
jgi:hypothetical protein